MKTWRLTVVVLMALFPVLAWGKDNPSSAKELRTYLQGLGNGSYLFGQMATWVHNENPDMDHPSNWLKKVYD
ncbi:MAG: hypothetical protein KBI32_15215, partial [Phycisphaerae bacterium]|nr:hypothetical protein [Phycisphaerae bacterium]